MVTVTMTGMVSVAMIVKAVVSITVLDAVQLDVTVVDVVYRCSFSHCRSHGIRVRVRDRGRVRVLPGPPAVPGALLQSGNRG